MPTGRTVSAKVHRGLWLALVSAAACNQVFGIEEAHVDPTILGAGGSLQGGGEGMTKGGALAAGGTATAGAAGSKAQGGSSNVPMAGAGGAPEGGAPVVSAGGNSMGGIVTQNGGRSTIGQAGSAADAGAGGVPTTPVSLCAQYCDSITKYCTGDMLQYKDVEQCLTVCEDFPQGVVGDPDGDSVACRLKYAGKARYAGGTELAAYCRQGGPGGDGRCGSNCEGFCDIAQATCTQSTTSPYYYGSRVACEATCNALPNIPFVYGNVSSADGNSVQCRLFHVMSAAMSDADEHCAHVMGITLCEATH
jgi:hypothetical protein